MVFGLCQADLFGCRCLAKEISGKICNIPRAVCFVLEQNLALFDLVYAKGFLIEYKRIVIKTPTTLDKYGCFEYIGAEICKYIAFECQCGLTVTYTAALYDEPATTNCRRRGHPGVLNQIIELNIVVYIGYVLHE